jgi:hypothetical protein
MARKSAARILDYSTLELERSRERRIERDRRKAIEDYNEATFGERRPLVGTLIRLFELFVVCAIVVMLVPRPYDLWAVIATIAIAKFWEYRRYVR